MLGRGGALICAAALLLVAGNAAATSYRVAPGSVVHPVDSESEEALAGSFELSPLVNEGDAELSALLIDDFVLQFDGESFGPRAPVEFEGRRALGLRIADHIQFEGDVVTLGYFQVGGELIGVNDAEVGFRFFEFRADGPDAGRLIGELADGAGPRRVELFGTVSEVDQYYRRPPDQCPIALPIPSPLPGGGGDVTIVAGAAGGLVHSFEEFDIAAGETVEFRQPGGSSVIGRVAGPNVSTIEGQIGAPVGVAVTPTLEALGITAPAGAVVSYDGGELVVSTSGDLFIADGVWSLPGLVSVRLEAGGEITIEGTLTLPASTTVHVDSGVGLSGNLVIGEGPLDPPVDIVIISPGILICELLPIFPAERRDLGEFTLLLSAAKPVEVDVRPHRIVPASRGFAWVVIYGGPDLEAREIDGESLRIGRGEAPALRRGRLSIYHFDANRDGVRDAIARFSVRDAEIAPGDTELCLFGELRDGTAIEGCDEIVTGPKRVPPRPRLPELVDRAQNPPPSCETAPETADAASRKDRLRSQSQLARRSKGRAASCR